MRKVKTASGATAVQIVHKTGSRGDGIDHIGSAHTAPISTSSSPPHTAISPVANPISISASIRPDPAGRAVRTRRVHAIPRAVADT